MSEAELQVPSSGEFRFRERGKIGEVKRRAVDDRASRDGASHERHAEIGGQTPPERSDAGDRTKNIAFTDEEQEVVGATKPGRAGDQRLEDGLHVRRRAADDAQDLSRRRLLLEGLGEVAVPHLQLLEQADVFDGDDRLVGKRLKQGDLSSREQADLGPRDRDRAERDAVPQQRDRQGIREIRAKNTVLQLPIFPPIPHMNQRASQNRASGNASPAWGDWEYAPDRIQSVRAQIVVGRQVDKLPVEAEYHAVGRLTQPPRARRDRLEGRLNVRRRATDHLKDLARRRLLLQHLRLALQRLCQTLLELADPRTFVL